MSNFWGSLQTLVFLEIKKEQAGGGIGEKKEQVEGEKYKKRSKLGIDKRGEGRSKKKSERRKEGLNLRI